MALLRKLTSDQRRTIGHWAMELVVVVASDEVDDRLLGVPRDAVWMDVPLATLSRLRREAILWQ